jgi:beta-fructofuranosidase
MWDTWYLVHHGVAHMFHLQRRAPASERAEADADWVGHAESDDLISWHECQLALGPGDPGSLDEMQPWTGCVVEHENRFYLYYTMRSEKGNGFGQHIGLALSDDLYHWVRYPENPVISPDSRWYIGHDTPLPGGVLDCRDLIVVRHPSRDGWLGFYAARVPAEEEAETAVIAAVFSPDLIHWEHLPPAFAPRKYACIEVPDVFFMNDKWYMTCLTGTGYGNRGIFSDKSVIRGTMYAVADQPEGPYQEIAGDNTFLGGDHYSGYSCRSLVYEDERYVFYTQPTPNRHDTLSPPMRVCTLPDGRLRLAYNSRSAIWRLDEIAGAGHLPQITQLPFSQSIWHLPVGRWQLRDDAYWGEARTGWQDADLGIGAPDIEIEAVITVEKGVAAGFVFRPDSALAWTIGDRAFLLDFEEGAVMSTRLPDFEYPCKRQYPLRVGQSYHVRVCIRSPRVEIYVDD